MDNYVIKLSNLSKVYGRPPTQVAALTDVNLEVAKGEFLAILGPSGSGKTTLLNQIGALDKPTSGTVILDGVETSAAPESRLFRIRRQKIGFIFQTYYLVPTMSALENVLVPVLPLGVRRASRQRAEMLLGRVGLEKRMRHKPGQLSGGEQQRVAIARALMLDPPIILADEPTGNLDSRTGMEVFNLMQELNREEGKTFVIVTHDQRLADMTDRRVYLQDGRLHGS